MEFPNREPLDAEGQVWAMPSTQLQYTFVGKVHPERCNVSIGPLEAHLDSLTHHGIRGVLRYHISLSQVVATFVSSEPVANIYTLKNLVEEAVRVALDALGFTKGAGYDLELTLMVDSTGNAPVVFGVNIPAVENAASAADISFVDIMHVFRDTNGKYLQLCLADLREALRVPKDTGLFCYRAIESLRQFFVNERNAAGDKASWEMLRTELGVTRTDIDAVKEFAKPLRHGGFRPISAYEREQVCRLTWNIVTRFVKYAKAGYMVT